MRDRDFPALLSLLGNPWPPYADRAMRNAKTSDVWLGRSLGYLSADLYPLCGGTNRRAASSALVPSRRAAVHAHKAWSPPHLRPGLIPLPVRLDKKPCLDGWKEYQARGATLGKRKSGRRSSTPRAWAVVTGAISNLVILDFDGEKGRNTLVKLDLEPHVRTGSGGFHVYIEPPGWRVPTLNGKTKRDLGVTYPGLDIRADGGYAVFSGRNSSGKYEKLRPRTPDTLDTLPTELRDILGLQSSDGPCTLPSSDRTAAPARTASTLLGEALDKIDSEGRNNSGFWLARQLRDRRYAFDAAARVMREYVARAPKVNQKGKLEPYTEVEALASLEQAYNREPRATPRLPYFETDAGLFWRKPEGSALRSTPSNPRDGCAADVWTERLSSLLCGEKYLV